MNVFDAILPVLFLAVSGLILLMIGAFAKRVSNFGMIFAAIGALVITARFVFFAPDETVLHGMVVIGQFTRFADLLVLLGAAGALILTTDYNETTGIARFEYPVLVLFAVAGMLVMVSAGDLLALYIGFEIQSITLYVLAAFARNSIRSSEAGLKYFVIGALSSGLLLFGISLVYGFAGTTEFSGIAKTLTIHSPEELGSAVGLVFVLVGLAYQISAAPFHMWTPDGYEGPPTSVTALFATAPKVAAFALLLRVMLDPFGHVIIQWQNLVQILAAASMAWGANFVVVKDAITRAPVLDFLTWRFVLAGLVLAALRLRALLRLGVRGWAQGVAVGLTLTGAYVAQTYGLRYTPAAEAGFLTGLQVVFTALLGWAILRARPSTRTWSAVLVATAGLAVF